MPPWLPFSSPNWPPPVKDRKQTVLEYLDDLYIDVGHHGDQPINKTYPGREGLAKIKT